MATIKVSVLAALVVVATAQTDFQQYALLSSNIAQQTAALQAQLAQSLSRVQSLTEQIDAARSAQSSTAAAMTTTIVDINSQLDVGVADALYASARMENTIEKLEAITAFGEVQIDILTDIVSVHEAGVTASSSSTMASLSSSVVNAISQANQAVSSEVSTAALYYSSTVASSISTMNSTVISTLEPANTLAATMALTHYMSATSPVFRWMMFHVYANNGIGWYDGNNPRHFGGRNPSIWGDGNPNVWEMAPSFAQMGRLFTRIGVGSVLGATVCAETWYLYSSTDTKYCLALFRINNPTGSAINSPFRWMGTGWSGWGNIQTATINGAANFRSDCTWWCERTYTFAFPPNRVSTLIFANGQSYPNYYRDNQHIMTTFLGFEGLALTNGLQYVDDLSTVTGDWR